MVNGIHSCKNCTSRTVGCHSKCEKYIKEKKEYDIKKNEEKHRKDMDEQLRSYFIGKRYGIMR